MEFQYQPAQLSNWPGSLVNGSSDLHYSNTDFAAKSEVGSLKDLLQDASKTNAGMEFVTAPQSSTRPTPVTTISYYELLKKAQTNARVIQQVAHSMRTQVVLIHFETIAENVEAFWSVVFADLLPVMSTSLPADIENRAMHLEHLKSLLGDPLCLASDLPAEQIVNASSLRVRTLHALISEANAEQSTNGSRAEQNENSPAVLMLTSGSTGNAKAVSLTTKQVIASVIGKAENWGSHKDSVFLNWIGLDHVANLVEIHMQAMFCGAKQVHVQASDLLQDPLLFLRLIDEHRVSYTFAPNFFLALLDKELISSDPSDPIRQVDLSCLQSIMSGGEANIVETAAGLTTRLQTLKAKGQVIRLGFGMTESCAACLYGMFDPQYEALEQHQFASIGKPIVTVRARVTLQDEVASVYEEGNLEISGPAVFSEYFNDPAATHAAFTTDGWFKTGDRAYVDKYGKFNLVGRTKEILNINGIKFAPVDIEALLEKANLPHTLSSYFAVFSDRSQSQQTEGYCVVYGVTDEHVSHEVKIATVEEISRITSAVVSVRPNWVISVPVSKLEKSALGKLSRAKIQKLFIHGNFDNERIQSSRPLLAYDKPCQAPKTAAEQKVIEVLSQLTDISSDLISTDATIFEIGLTSISLFRFERLLRQKFDLEPFASGQSASVITFLSNPTITAIADALDNVDSKIYNPVAQIQSRGTKTPLWLCHPASGNVLAFLPLARTVTDRPLYALTARGLRHNETLFSSIEEMCDTYFEHVKRVQPQGPYALTGYSLGTTVAFELAKRLEANGDSIAFCAALDSPPHVIPLVEHLDWTAAAVLVSYFLELIAQDDVPQLISDYRGLPQIETVKRLLDVARPAQRQALSLDSEQLLAIVNVTDNFGTMAKAYTPVGNVNKIDVFFCTPLHSVERDRKTWIQDHLSKWQDFSREQIEFHECEGDHADMLNPTYVQGFARRLRAVLTSRGCEF